MDKIINIISWLDDFKNIKPKNTGNNWNTVKFSNSLSSLEQEIFDEIIGIENSWKFDIWNLNRLELLQKINQEKVWMDRIFLKKVKWYLKSLLALNLSNEETMNYLKTNLMYLLDSEEQEYLRSLESPFLVWFDRDKNWKIVPIYGNKIFRSERNISWWIFFSKEAKKEVALIPWAIKEVSEMELKKNWFWDLLPQDLRDIFENWSILQTTGDDFYDINWPYQKWAFAYETQAETLAKIDENIQIWVLSKQMYNWISNYMLLYYWEYWNIDNGRTWVLVEMKNWKLEPVKVEIDWIEYIVEIKWCWLRSWWFWEMQSRTWDWEIISWWAKKEQAIDEFNVLNWVSNWDWPKVAGIVLFNNSWYDQWQIIRLSPSTVRASYTGNKCYEDLENKSQVEKVLDMYVKWFSEMIFSPLPRIINRSAHSENLLLWWNWNSCWTDYSDHFLLNSSPSAENSRNWWFITVKRLLSFFIEMKKEIPWYNEDFRWIFIWNLIKYFKENLIDLEIDENSTDENITIEIWKKFIAYQTFKQKCNSWFLPDKIERDFEDVRKDFLSRYENNADFVEKIKKLALKLQPTLEIFLLNNKKELIQDTFYKIIEVLSYIKSWNYIKLLNKNYLETIYKIFRWVDSNISNLLVESFSVWFDLNSTILFLESEIDMLENAFNWAVNEEKTIIQRGLEFYKLKLEYIKKVNNFELSLEEIFEFMRNFKFEDIVFNYKY